MWAVAAILDWELAFSGSPLLDVGHFLRYELDATPLREPHFSRAFTHDELPSDVEAELFALINATFALQ